MVSSYLQQLADAIREFLPSHFFSRFALGRVSSWRPQRLTWIALMMAWAEGQTLSSRWEQGCEAAAKVHPHWRLGDSYTGFTKALVRASDVLIPALIRDLQAATRGIARKFWNCGKWTAFAVDGTRIETPHTLANEEGLGCAGRLKTTPQVFLTTLWHIGTGLPWSFRVGPGTDSERDHRRRMIAELPARSMIVADAGFAGYELFASLLWSGHSFLIRVGRNVTLLKGLGYYHEEHNGLVCLWPACHHRRRPLVLRLIELKAGSQRVCLLTNVLDPQAFDASEAAALYRRRWGEEVFYRSYKQTMDRHTTLSRTPQTCQAEVSWMVLGLWLLGLMTVRRIIESGGEPATMSVARAREVVRRALRESTRGTRAGSAGAKVRGGVAGRRRRDRPPELSRELSAARKDQYRRKNYKGARDYPRKKREKPPRPPKIRPAGPTEIEKARGHPSPSISYQWTA